MRRGIAGGLAVGGVLAALGWIGTNAWRQQTIARLKAGSTCVQTSRGAVECSILYPQAEKTPVLLLHGSPGGYDQAQVVGSMIFSAERMLIAPSRPGYLRTAIELGRTPGEQAELMAALLDALNIEKAIVMPFSGGGPVGMEFALRYPERTAALINVSAVTSALDDPVNLNTFQRSDLAAWLTLMVMKTVPAVLGQAVRQTPAARDAMMQLAETTFPIDLRMDGWINDAEQLKRLSPVPMEQIHRPTLMVHGSADENVPFAQAQAAAATIPNATLVTIEGGEHNFSIFDPMAARQIHNFLRDYAL
jgi:pimeloyl-ACP methyl ester carboxylesterase